MAYVINSIDKCKQLKDLSKYAVFFFYNPNMMDASVFRKSFGPLLDKVRGKRDFKCGQLSKSDVEIPRESFGFESDYGVIFYRDGVYLTYMTNFNELEFAQIVDNIDSVPMVRVGRYFENSNKPVATTTIDSQGNDVCVKVNGRTIVVTSNGDVIHKNM
ncbi:hypothetical protein EV175_000285 [Coemansia sp. RSA 1933]|nr:hypothetical protein EV175_000285 [Coemansia sp. RSA 1933]